MTIIVYDCIAWMCSLCIARVKQYVNYLLLFKMIEADREADGLEKNEQMKKCAQYIKRLYP